MRKSRLLIVMACLLSGFVGTRTCAGQEAGGAAASAPQAQPPRGRVEREVQRMRESLGLADDQVAKIRTILETRNNQLKDLRANYSMPQGEARTKAAEIRKSARKQIDQVLTPQQRQKQKALRRGQQVDKGQ